MAYIITEPCVGVCDTACVTVCPVDCIYPAEGNSFETEYGKKKMRDARDMLYIHPEAAELRNRSFLLKRPYWQVMYY